MIRFRLLLGAAVALALSLAVFDLHAAITQSEARFKFTAVQTGTNNVQAPAFAPTIEKIIQFTEGTSNNQYDILWVDKRTLAASGTEDLDLTGTALKSAFQANIAIAEVVGVIVIADPGNTNDVKVGGAAANGWFGMFQGAAHVALVKPGGLFVNIAPNSAGLGAVTAGTADLLTIANSSGSSGVTYTIAIIGRSS